MKKLVLLLLAGMLLPPREIFAEKFKSTDVVLVPRPARTPALWFISMNLDENTGDLVICPNYDITGLQITIIGNGITYLDTTVSLGAGQAYLDCLDYLTEGTYMLTLTVSDGSVINQYEITVEPD